MTAAARRAADLAAAKAELRRRAKSLPGAGAAESALCQCALTESDLWAAAFSAGLYRAVPGEVATELLFADAARLGMDVAVPASTASGGYAWRRAGAGTKWIRGPHGIEEPAPGAGSGPARAAELRVVVVPGVAFDRAGHRLGHGSGAYDRLLARCGGAVLVGFCPEARLLDEVPAGPRDVAVDAVVCAGRFLWTPSAEAKLARFFGGAWAPSPDNEPAEARP